MPDEKKPKYDDYIDGRLPDDDALLEVGYQHGDQKFVVDHAYAILHANDGAPLPHNGQSAIRVGVIHDPEAFQAAKDAEAEAQAEREKVVADRTKAAEKVEPKAETETV